MTSPYLAREDAPISDTLWRKIDETVISTASRRLSGRRLLELEGPFGIGLKSVPLPDREITPGILASGSQPVFLIRESFTLPIRDLAAFERDPVALDLSIVADAAREIARREDELVYNGTKGVPGLIHADHASTLALGTWDEVGQAAGEIIKAVSLLDEKGFHGPYALALSPARFNLLFRIYPDGNRVEVEHIRRIASAGVIKAPALASGGILLQAGIEIASIIVGQDMSVGFVGPAGDGTLEFSISESLTPIVRQPAAVCVLE